MTAKAKTAACADAPGECQGSMRGRGRPCTGARRRAELSHARAALVRGAVLGTPGWAPLLRPGGPAGYSRPPTRRTATRSSSHHRPPPPPPKMDG
eukprot:1077218-Pyramimonas_sp.AAC.1